MPCSFLVLRFFPTPTLAQLGSAAELRGRRHLTRGASHSARPGRCATARTAHEDSNRPLLPGQPGPVGAKCWRPRLSARGRWASLCSSASWRLCKCRSFRMCRSWEGERQPSALRPQPGLPFSAAGPRARRPTARISAWLGQGNAVPLPRIQPSAVPRLSPAPQARGCRRSDGLWRYPGGPARERGRQCARKRRAGAVAAAGVGRPVAAWARRRGGRRSPHRPPHAAGRTGRGHSPGPARPLPRGASGRHGRALRMGARHGGVRHSVQTERRSPPAVSAECGVACECVGAGCGARCAGPRGSAGTAAGVNAGSGDGAGRPLNVPLFVLVVLLLLVLFVVVVVVLLLLHVVVLVVLVQLGIVAGARRTGARCRGRSVRVEGEPRRRCIRIPPPPRLPRHPPSPAAGQVPPPRPHGPPGRGAAAAVEAGGEPPGSCSPSRAGCHTGGGERSGCHGCGGRGGRARRACASTQAEPKPEPEPEPEPEPGRAGRRAGPGGGCSGKGWRLRVGTAIPGAGSERCGGSASG